MARRPASSTSTSIGRSSSPTPTSWSRPPTCTTARPSCSSRRSRPTRRSTGTPRPPVPARCCCTWVSRASCRSWSTTRCSSPASGSAVSTRSSEPRRRCPSPPRSTSASPVVSIRMSHPKATRTCSCSCRSPPIPRSGAATSTVTGTPASRCWPTGSLRRSPTGRASRIWPRASPCAAPWAPATSPTSCTPGAAPRWVRRTRSSRARSSGRATCRRRSTGSTTWAARRSRASGCRCA